MKKKTVGMAYDPGPTPVQMWTEYESWVRFHCTRFPTHGFIQWGQRCEKCAAEGVLFQETGAGQFFPEGLWKEADHAKN